MKMLASAAAAALALGFAAGPAAAAYVYAPAAAFQTQEAESNAVLFNRVDQRFQWIFDASTFGDDPLLVNGASFRFDSIVFNIHINQGVFELDEDFKVQLATLAGAPSPVQNNNLAGGVTVLSGARDLPFLIGAPAGQTKPFGVHFVFDTPYLYNPAAGDLVFDVVFPAQDMFGTMDYSRTDTRMRIVAGGIVGSGGPVTRFDVQAPPPTAVPEPATWALMILGFGGAGALLRRRFSAAACRRAPPAGWNRTLAPA